MENRMDDGGEWGIGRRDRRQVKREGKKPSGRCGLLPLQLEGFFVLKLHFSSSISYDICPVS